MSAPWVQRAWSSSRFTRAGAACGLAWRHSRTAGLLRGLAIEDWWRAAWQKSRVINWLKRLGQRWRPALCHLGTGWERSEISAMMRRLEHTFVERPLRVMGIVGLTALMVNGLLVWWLPVPLGPLACLHRALGMVGCMLVLGSRTTWQELKRASAVVRWFHAVD